MIYLSSFLIIRYCDIINKRDDSMNNKNKLIKISITMIISVILYILITFLIDKFIKNLPILNIIMIITTILFILFMLIIFKEELKIVYYECRNCKHLFKPKYKDALLAPHIGIKRYLKCPKCNEKNWNRKVLNKVKNEKNI